VEHFDSIDDVLEVLQKEVVADEMRARYPLHARYEYLWMAAGSLIPSVCSPFISPFLYRGQIARYRPCLASVFRGLKCDVYDGRGLSDLLPVDRIRLFVERIRLEEFVLALCDHPAMEYAAQIGLCMQPFGLAQHYEMATDQLDLSQDHNVAAFFATNYRIASEWVPASQGLGVIYRVRTGPLLDSRPGHVEFVGKQVLPRPEQQKAFTLRLPIAYDFERMNVEVFTFRQVPSCGRRLQDRYSGGAALFPPDVMAEVAETIRSEKTISRHVVEWLMDYDEHSREYMTDSTGELYRLIWEHLGVRVSNRGRFSLTASQQQIARVAVEQVKSTFLHNVGAIAVREQKGNLSDPWQR